MREDFEKPVVKTRRIIKHGKSYYISIPHEFMKRHNLKKGQPVPVLANHIMKVVPMQEQ